MLIRRGSYADVAWSPDGRSLLALECPEIECEMPQAWQLDVSAIVSPQN